MVDPCGINERFKVILSGKVDTQSALTDKNRWMVKVGGNCVDDFNW